MQKAILFLNGEKPNKKVVDGFIQKNTFIICADGGAEHALSLGFIPSIVIGDFDSISAKTKDQLQKLGVQFIEYPKEKNATDSELALDYLIQKKFEEVVVFGLNGDRLDHLLANIFVFAKKTAFIKISIISNNQRLYFVTDKLSVNGKKGDFVTLLALTPKVTGLSSTNLKYKLSNATLPFGTSLGISNELTGSIAKISFNTGVLLVIHSKIKYYLN